MDKKYIKAERRLAELLGWENVQLGGNLEGLSMPENWLHGIWPVDGKAALAPQWCRDNAAAFALMVEHNCCTERYTRSVSARCRGCRKAFNEKFSIHPDRETAVRYAIVQAVIAKLEAK